MERQLEGVPYTLTGNRSWMAGQDRHLACQELGVSRIGCLIVYIPWYICVSFTVSRDVFT